MFFTDDYRTDLNDYDYCGNDHVEEADPYKSFSWRHTLITNAKALCELCGDGSWCYYVAYRAI